jgi:hypothetical protein
MGGAGPGAGLEPGPKNLPLFTRLSMTRSISAESWSGLVAFDMCLTTNLHIAMRKHWYRLVEQRSLYPSATEVQAVPMKPAAVALATLEVRKTTYCS